MTDKPVNDASIKKYENMLGEMEEDTQRRANKGRICGSCGAPIIWVRDRHTGEQVALDDNPVYRYVKSVVGTNAFVECLPTYTRHFDTCPKMDNPRR